MQGLVLFGWFRAVVVVEPLLELASAPAFGVAVLAPGVAVEAGGIAVVGHGVEVEGVVDGVAVVPGAALGVVDGAVVLGVVLGVVVCVPGVFCLAAPGVAVELGGVAVEPPGVAVVCATARLPASINPPSTITFAFINRLPINDLQLA
jgi:hypothetical protein